MGPGHRQAAAHPGPHLAVYGVAFSPDGRLLATAGYDGRVWDPATGKQLRILGHTGPVWGVAFSPDGRLLGTAGNDGTARLWDPATGKQLSTLTLARISHVYGMAFSPDGRLLATADGDDHKARLGTRPPAGTCAP